MKDMKEEKMMKKGKSSKKEGKMCALKELRDMMTGMMGSDLADLKKVTVAAKDEEGLKAGLKKAKQLLDEEEDESEEYED